MWCQSSVAALFLVFTSVGFPSYASGQDHDVCTTTINIGSYKRSTAYVLGTAEDAQCDQSINDDIWYNFDAPTGGKMPEVCIAMYHCGSTAPVWLNGTHPTAEAPGPVTRTVCAQKVSNGPCCEWSGEINVKWCEDPTTKKEFFIYQLKRPPNCGVSFCAGDSLSCSANCAWNSVISNCSCPAFPAITQPVLSEPYISTTRSVVDPRGTQFIATKFSINCTVGYAKQQVDDGARFLVALLSNGSPIAKVVGTSLEPALSFEEDFLHGHLGTNITCWAKSFWMSSTPQYGDTQMSNAKWFGLQAVAENGELITNPVIKDGEVFAFRIQPNFPITSPICFTNPPDVPCRPIYAFQITADKAGRVCECQFTLSPFNNASGLITVSPAPFIGKRAKPFIWEITFANQTNEEQTTGTIFQDYILPSILVEIVDSGTRPLCSSTGDPHVTTFPVGPSKKGLLYNIYLVGDFYLVKATTRLFQMQVRHFPCTPSVSCNCALMVREGNNVLGIDSCPRGEGPNADSTPRLIRYLVDLESPGGEIETTGSGWTITMLSGFKITVDRGYKAGVLDFHIIGLSSDTYTGLCTYEGSQIDSCTTDCEQFRVPEEENMFNYNSSNIPKCYEAYVIPSCDCHRREGDNSINVTCAPPNQSNLLRTNYRCQPPPGKIVPEKPPLEDKGTPHVDPGWVAPTKPRFDIPGPAVTPVWPTPTNHITEPEAEQACNSALTNCAAYPFCRDHPTIDFPSIISTCVLDIQITDELSPARSVPAQLERICGYSLAINITVTINGTDASSSDARNTLEQLNDNICPNQCSNKGKCVKSSCVCDSGYIGSDCLFPKDYVPVIKEIIPPQCAVSPDVSCGKVLVVTPDDLSGYNASCQIKNAAGEIKFDSMPVVSGAVVICSLSFEPIPGTYSLSISIDGQSYSVEKQYIILTPDVESPTTAAIDTPNVETTVTAIPPVIDTTLPGSESPPNADTTAMDIPTVETTVTTIPPDIDTTPPANIACPGFTQIWEEFQQCLDAARKKTIQ